MITYADFLLWLYGEMVLKYNDHPYVDYLLRLRKIGLALLDQNPLYLNPAPESRDDSLFGNLERVSRLGSVRNPTTDAEFLAWTHDRLELKHRCHRLDPTMILFRQIIVKLEEMEQKEAEAAAFFALEDLRNEAVSLGILSAESVTQDNFPATIERLIESYGIELTRLEDNTWHALDGNQCFGFKAPLAEEAVLNLVLKYHKVDRD